MRRSFLTAPLLAAATVLALACGGNSNENKQPGPPTAIKVSAGDQQTGQVGQELGAPIAAKVVDANGRGVPGQSVDFTVMAGGGHLSTTSALTNAAGVAFASWTLGPSAGSTQQVRARVLDENTGAVVGTVTFSATATSGPASEIVITAGSGQQAEIGQRVADSVRVRVYDAYGNTVPDATVTFAVLTGGGTASPTSAKSRADGTAATAWTLGSTSGTQTLRASIGTVASVTAYATALRPRDGTSVNLSGRPYALAVSHDVVYVGRLDMNAVARFNGSSTNVAASIAVGSTPTELAFNPAGTTAYVTNQFSDNIGIIDVATNTQTSTIPVTGDPFKLIVSPDGTTLYVTTNANNVYKIDIASKTVSGSLATGATANGLALNADGSKLYVSTRDGGSVIEVNTSDMTASRTFTTGGRTQEVVVGPNDAELYVANEFDGKLYIFNLSTGTLAGSVSNLGDGPWGMALSPDGTKLWISVLWTGEVKVVDRVGRTISRSLYTGGTPRRIGFLSNGTAVVANEAGYVTWLQ